MNFYNNEEEDKKGAPVIPGTASPFKKTSAFGKQPMFSRTAGSIIDRLKNLSRKDMAFVGIGLSVLVMAPVAEYMMSQPAQDNLLKETFNPRSGPGGVIDPGINGLSTGSSDGSGEVITPLSSRDPLSLILGAQPAAAVMPPPSAPPTTSYRDAMKESGRAAFTEASKSAGAPTVIPKMQSAMSRLFADGGGSRTSGTLGGGKIIEDARSASSKAAKRSMVGPVAMPGYKGVASNTPNSASKGAFEKLRAQADKSAGNFSGGSAMNSLDKAAADAVNASGSGGLGAGGESEKIKGGSGSTTKYDHNRSGETLAEAAAKARQQKALEWEFFKKYEFKKQLLTAVFGAVSTKVGKFVGGAVGGVLNPAAPAPPPTYCWSPKSNPASTQTSDCAGGSVKTPIYKDKDGKPYPYPPNYSCICGFGPSPTEGPAGGNPPGGNPPGSNPGQMPSAVPVDAAKELEAYDTALVQMAEEAVGGDAATEPKKLLGHAKAAAASMAKCADIAKRLAANVQTKTPEQVAREKQAYSSAISTARIDVTLARKKFNDFSTRLTTEIDKLEKKEKIVKDGVETVQIGGVDTLAVLKAIKIDADNYDKSSITTAEKKLAFHEKAVALYDEQSGDVTAKAGGVAGYANERLGNLAGLTKDLAAIKEDALKAEDLTVIKEIFKSLTGRKAESVVIPPPPPGTEPAAAVIPVKTAAEAEEAPYLVSAIAWRGAEEQKLWSEKKVDDSLAKKTEGETWLKLSPYKRLESGKFEDTSFPAGPVAKDVVSMSLRGIVVLPFDMKGSQGYLPGVTLGMGVLDTKLAGWKQQLKEAGLDFDAAPTTPAPANPAPVAADPLVGRQTALLANARNANADYNTAKGMKITGNSQNAQWARNDFAKMTDSNANINRITAVLQAPGAKPTKEQLDELEMYTNNFNKAFTDFQGHAAKAGTPVPPKPQPQQPLVVIQNNVQGGNATAINQTGVNANATANATNKVPAVVPPVIPPVVQPAAPKPIEPAPNLRLNMPDNSAMTVSRTQFYPNTGSAIYTGYYRESGSYLGILAKNAYNYQVSCTRSGTTYKISKIEAAPVAFPAGEKNGWVMELLIKKFLRISDIQFGRLYDVSSQRSDLIGRTCHQ